MNHEQASGSGSLLVSRRGIALLVVVGLIGLFLFSDYRPHRFGILPYLLLLACPLMHFFMHGRHGGHGKH
jgi:hypothetical protein